MIPLSALRDWREAVNVKRLRQGVLEFKKEE